MFNHTQAITLPWRITRRRQFIARVHHCGPPLHD
jgi:hypothetical protein